MVSIIFGDNGFKTANIAALSAEESAALNEDLPAAGLVSPESLKRKGL
ncbi:MAG: hypothetical protein LBE09_08065 [Christensenellaceae bacterium]|nr:hypothetical protein [Christensenellaceae bacterium]